MENLRRTAEDKRKPFLHKAVQILRWLRHPEDSEFYSLSDDIAYGRETVHAAPCAGAHRVLRCTGLFLRGTLAALR